ncbi:MAG: phosphopantetheine adenylyltransferase [Betaproteobacteria bacterium]
MHRLAPALLLIAGVIHLLPLPGVLGAPQLARLYGVTVDDPSLAILLRHRAVLFGLLGAFLVAAVFKPEWRLLAATLALVSAVAFLVIALGVGGYNGALQRVVIADVVAVACLLGVVAVELALRRA